MSRLTIPQVYALARDAGLDPAAAVIATAIAIGESGLRTDAVGDVALQDATWGPSIGLWQIRSLRAESGTGGPRDATRLTDPRFNARSMASISSAGRSWRPWTVFTSGAWRRHLADVTAQVGADPTDLSGLPVVGEIAQGLTGRLREGVTGVGLRIGLVGAGLALIILGAMRITGRSTRR